MSLGGLDVVSSLGRAGIRCAVSAGRQNPARYSRFVDQTIDFMDSWREPDAYVARLVEWAVTQPTPPVLFYASDADLLMASRHRETLGTAFRMVLPDEELVENLVDKERFRKLAEQLGLPVPQSQHLGVDLGPDPEIALSFPLIVKPVARRDANQIMANHAKAVRAADPAEFRTLWATIAALGVECIAQELVPGPESCIESYHAYVDDEGHTVHEFAGAKLRTDPPEYGHSTAVVITGQEDVLAEGRRVIKAIDLRGGVAKVDFKRGPDGRLWLLEVNPRFNLWHHPGAVAGANLPALVYADLSGLPRPQVGPVRAGVTWCAIRADRRAAAAAGLSRSSHLRFVARSTTRSTGAWSDPMPVLRSHVLPAVRTRLLGSTGV